MVNIQRILCPVDFSEPSRHALEHAVASAKRHGAQITICHVYSQPQPLVFGPEMAAGTSSLPPVQSQAVVDEVRRFSESVVIDGSPEIVVTEGVPAKEIVQLAERMAADLLVMGTHGRGGFEQRFLGSVTEKVLRTTSCPVLTVPPPSPGPAAGPVLYKTVLCPLDFSDASSRAIEYAVSLAKEPGTHLILLHVVEGLIEPRYLDINASFTVPEYRLYVEQDAMTQLKAAIPDEARTWCEPEERVAAGKAYREILRVAAETGADLIVMGAHSGGAVERWVFGSTTHHILQEAACPVLTLRT